MVDRIKPPITTVASGRCTSAPADVAMAIGTKPSEATSRLGIPDVAGVVFLFYNLISGHGIFILFS